MAAALFRTSTGLCCIHRELCRVVWRSQTVLFSSKPSDRKQPRRTHIKKAKPQPAVDVTKLLEQIFSQQRPGTAPPAGTAQPPKASSRPTKPPTTSTMNVFTSNIPPLSKTDARSLSNVTAPMTAGSSPSSITPAAVEHQPSAETVEAKVETPTILPLPAQEVEKITETSCFPAATVEPSIETIVESPVEAVETPETRSAVVEGLVELTVDATVDVAAQELETNSTDSGVVDISHTATVEPIVESTVELSVEASPLEAPQSRAAVAEDSENTIEAEAVETNSSILHIAKEETAIESPIEALETLPLTAIVGCPVEPKVDVKVDVAAQEVETNSTDSGPCNLSHTAKEQPSIEPTIEQADESSMSPLEPIEGRSTAAEESVETTIEADAHTAALALETNTAKEDPLIETTIETPVEAVETLETRGAIVEGPVESTIDVTVDVAAQKVASGDVNISYSPKEEPLIETTIESAISEGTVETALIPIEQESSPLPSKIESTLESSSINEEVSRSEEMTLESVTLHVDQVLVASIKTDELLQTKSLLDRKAEKQLQELIAAATEIEDSREDESDNLNEVLSKWDSLSEDLQELEGESGLLVKELLCNVPAVLSETPATVKTSSDGEQMETEAMTLESVTLAELKAELGGLETEALQEAMDALEREAEAKEDQIEVTTMIEDVAEFEDEISTLESISEATDAIEAIMMEVMLGAEQGSRQPLQGQESEKESGEKQESAVEAMSLESVTLAEVKFSLRTLEDESLSETSDYLEKEAEMVAGEKKVEGEDVVVSEETTETLELQSLSEVDALSEDLQIDALMEELIFSVPGHITGVTEGLIGQEVVRADVLDETEATGSVDTAAELSGDVPASPVQREVLLEEEEEEGAQAEASGSEDVRGTHEGLDPMQRLFLDKIREYNNIRRLNGGPLEAEPDYEKLLSEEIVKLQRLYGGGDLSSFPQFTFTDPKMDQDSK